LPRRAPLCRRFGCKLRSGPRAHVRGSELVPDDLIIGIMASEMKKPEVDSKGWLLDGVPRTKAQCLELDKACGKPDLVLWLDVCLARIQGLHIRFNSTFVSFSPNLTIGLKALFIYTPGTRQEADKRRHVNPR